ncbi:MAG TPA: MauE/DoxX family redox-associated membrane protein [Chitinophagaceae bacterium]|nr:MauE/DoxX family redox-associated membrane protein [Chitinophagaceae bacterium]
MIKKTIIDIISISLILLFGYAAASKLNEHEQFILQIGQVIKIRQAPEILSWFVPGTEFLTCLLLIIPKHRRKGLYLSFGLMLSFTCYIAFFLAYHTHLPCRCGGILNSMGWNTHLKFNIVFTALAAIGIVLDRTANKENADIKSSIAGI